MNVSSLVTVVTTVTLLIICVREADSLHVMKSLVLCTGTTQTLQEQQMIYLQCGGGMIMESNAVEFQSKWEWVGKTKEETTYRKMFEPALTNSGLRPIIRFTVQYLYCQCHGLFTGTMCSTNIIHCTIKLCRFPVTAVVVWGFSLFGQLATN